MGGYRELPQDTLQVLSPSHLSMLRLLCGILSVFEGEEIKKESCYVAQVSFELLPRLPRVLR